jgi:hypothetical protein
VGVNRASPLYDEIFSPELVMARVGHLDRAKRRDVEHITRIIRESFNSAGVLDPKPRITRVLLIGPYAHRAWRGDDDLHGIPAYDIWIIVNDRLFTHKRLWQATEARIAEAVGGRYTVRLSFSTARGVRIGKRSGDEYIVDRLNSSITLFRAKRDAPSSRRRKGRAIWADALTRFEAATADFQPATERFRKAERAWSAARRAAPSVDVDRVRLDRIDLNAARVTEKRLGDALHEATMALLHTPAPDLAAIIRKLELVRDIGDGDDHATISILADMRWISSRQLAIGQSS